MHLSDLHVGMSNQGWLWPALKKAFVDDIKNLHRKRGAWDVVLFSGDLTQKATVKEYQNLTQILIEIWSVFHDLGFSPFLFPVPGNHDLTRPPSLNAASKILGQWWLEVDIQKAFWEPEGLEYRNLISSTFKNYTDWLGTIELNAIPLPKLKPGCIAGDHSTIVEVRGQRVGLIGLNSSWLQLSDGDYKGKLHVDTRQLLAVTGDEPDDWCSKNNFNLLITHHPTDWLHPQSQAHWKSEIFTHNRFDCHLHGHMHEPNSTTISEGGFASRRSKQGASLFGLEAVGQTGFKRIHGYSVFNLVEANGTRSITVWPRTKHTGTDGTHKLVPNHDFNITDEGYFEESYSLQSSLQTQAGAKTDIAPHNRIANALEILISLRLTLPSFSAHSEVRRVEQNHSISALKEERALWLVADWGLGSEQFIHSILDRLSVSSEQVYQLDCQHYFNRREVLDGIHDQTGCSFEHLCGLIAALPRCILLLDDVPIAEGKDKDAKKLQTDIEQVASIFLQYCENALLIIKSRLNPTHSSLPTVELNPLDEADTAIYIAAKKDRGQSTFTRQQIGQLFRHTDGVPARIDSVLSDIRIVGTSELHRLNTDVAGKAITTLEIAPGLVQTISELQTSKEPAVEQAFKLLKTLTIFPRGELLNTIKRFNQSKSFYPQDARLLMELALIDTVEVLSVHPTANASDGARALLVRRPVREYLYSILSETERKQLNKLALNLYFGSDWALNGIRSSKNHRFDDRKCGAWQIGNANMMVLRAAREAVDAGNKSSQKKAVELANAYCAAIRKGDHYTGVITLCSEIIPLFESIEDSSLDLSLLQSKYGCALRMTGEYERARVVLEDIDRKVASKTLRQSILLDIALVCRTLKDNEAATAAAEELVKLNPKSDLALQAQALLAGLNTADPDKENKLSLIEKKAIKQGAFVVTHNLALNRAAACKQVKERMEILESVSLSAQKHGDHYNGMRATLNLATLILDNGGNLSQNQLNNAIDSYHYLYSDSIGGLFTACHDVLWRTFLQANETDNLLRLFRHSSLIWRLRGNEKAELTYLKSLNEKINIFAKIPNTQPHRELTYFRARSSHFIKTVSSS